jgi:molybdate-binding protein/DNA-binding transcriptional regulator YhcF (GntR family)
LVKLCYTFFMDESHLYRQLAEKVRQEILEGVLKPGDRLPPLREMAAQWSCTIGTVQHAYQELVQQGLVTSRAGQGTRVVERPPGSVQSGIPLRRAALVHRAESFLLEAVTAGYSLEEVDSAVRQAMDRWRVMEQSPQESEAQVLRFAGSHDLAVTWLAGIFPTLVPGSALRVQITGSLGGLLALANGQADLAGAHLWDAGTDSYNLPYVQRFFPGQRMALVTLAGRRLGLLTAPGNPLGIGGLADLDLPEVRFINRNPGSGTRVWLDAMLQRMGISPQSIRGYEHEQMTHLAVAQAVAQGQADVGLGLQGAAMPYGLDFIFLAQERYDLVIPEAVFHRPEVQALVGALAQPGICQSIQALGGYDTSLTGTVIWV